MGQTIGVRDGGRAGQKTTTDRTDGDNPRTDGADGRRDRRQTTRQSHLAVNLSDRADDGGLQCQLHQLLLAVTEHQPAGTSVLAAHQGHLRTLCRRARYTR